MRLRQIFALKFNKTALYGSDHNQASPISSSCTISMNVNPFFSKIAVEAFFSGAVLAVITIMLGIICMIRTAIPALMFMWILRF